MVIQDMTPETKKAIADHWMKWYKVICFCGAALMVGTDKAALLNGLYQYNHTAAQVVALYLTTALVSILLGIIASSFPDTAPCARVVAWNGSLQAFLFVNAFIHLKMFKLYPELSHLTGSFMATSMLLSLSWRLCARDPTVPLVEAAHHE